MQTELFGTVDAVFRLQVIAAAVGAVAGVERLVQVADEVDQEQQRLDPLLVRRDAAFQDRDVRA